MDVKTLDVKASLSGHAYFELRDLETGAIEQSWDQSNLITDAGLDFFGSISASAGTAGSATLTRWGAWRSFLCVGTGSTAPATNQTALANQVQIGADTGGFQAEQTETYWYDAGTNSYRAEIRQVRVLNFTTSYNLAEWGFAPAATGSISIRELFRGADTLPTVIAVSNGKQLKVTHALNMSIPATFGAVSFDQVGLTPVATVTGNGGFWTSSSAGEVLNLFVNLLDRSATARMNWNTTVVALPTANQATAWFAAPQTGKIGTVDAYVGGSRKHTRRWAMATSEANGNLNELVYCCTATGQTSGGAVHSGYAFRFTSALTKTSTNTTTFVFDVSWTRG